MAIRDWLNILKLKGTPSFTDIHELDRADFLQQYFHEDPDLLGFMDNLLESLEGKYPIHAVRIQAPPGWGKTSFFHYLAQVVEDRRIPRYICIFKANDIAGQEGVHRAIVHARCLSALKAYFERCCSDQHIADDILRNPGFCDRDRVIQFVSFLRDHRKSFAMPLLVVLDGVDVVPEEHAVETVMELFNLLDTPLIIKWLAIRDSTYLKYSKEVQRRFVTFFPGLYSLPSIPLYEIANLRIRHVGEPQCLNPFSRKLCLQTQRLAGGDHRQGLACLMELAQRSNVPDIPPARLSPERIQTHFERASTRVFLEHGLIPNVFHPDLNPSRLVPLTKEVLALVYYHNSVDRQFMHLLNGSLASKVDGPQTTGAKRTGLTYKDISRAMQVLKKLDLIDYERLDDIGITERGYVMRDYIEEEFYVSECQRALLDVQYDDVFWRIARLRSDYRILLMERYFGKVLDTETRQIAG